MWCDWCIVYAENRLDVCESHHATRAARRKSDVIVILDAYLGMVCNMCSLVFLHRVSVKASVSSLVTEYAFRRLVFCRGA